MRKSTQCILTLVIATACAGVALPLQAQQNTGTTGTGSIANNSQAGGMSETPKNFLKHAQVSSEFEKQAAELGTQRAQNRQLKQFSQQLLQQHGQTQQKLQALAQAQGLPANEPLPSRLTQQLAQLDKERGQAFDKNLATCLLRENARSLQRSQQAAQQIQNQRIKRFAQTLQQEQQQHMQKAANIAKAVGVSQSTISSLTSQENQAMGGTGETQSQITGSGSSGQQTQQPGQQPGLFGGSQNGNGARR